MEIEFVEPKLLMLSILTEQEDLEDHFNLKFTPSFSADDRKTFFVKFDVELTFSVGVVLTLKYGGLFKTKKEITEEFRKGSFVKVNAPAITFPYLRSFITTVSVNAGLEPIILPTVNFQDLAASAIEET